MAVRRMYEAFPALGIQFATPTYPFAMAPPAPVPAALPAAPLAASPSTAAPPATEPAKAAE
jgi:hypothetical protein